MSNFVGFHGAGNTQRMIPTVDPAEIFAFTGFYWASSGGRGLAHFILSSIQLYKEMIAQERKSSEADSAQTETKGTNLGSVLGWVLGFPLIIYFLGFFIAIPLLLLAYIKLRGRSWVATITIAVITTALIYGVFEFSLKADLWKGLIFNHLL